MSKPKYRTEVKILMEKKRIKQKNKPEGDCATHRKNIKANVSSLQKTQ